MNTHERLVSAWWTAQERHFYFHMEDCTWRLYCHEAFSQKKSPSIVKEITDKTFNYIAQSRMEWDWMMIHPQHKYYAIEKYWTATLIEDKWFSSTYAITMQIITWKYQWQWHYRTHLYSYCCYAKCYSKTQHNVIITTHLEGDMKVYEEDMRFYGGERVINRVSDRRIFCCQSGCGGSFPYGTSLSGKPLCS